MVSYKKLNLTGIGGAKEENSLSNKELFNQIQKLSTEQRNPASQQIDTSSTQDIIQIMNDEDQKVALAVQKKLPEITRAVNLVVEAFQDGGRLIYIGSGTSGRLGVLDAAECPPTFGTNPEMVQGLIAGGEKAMFVAQEGAEDSTYQAGIDLEEKGLIGKDVVCGLAASGRTPYVLGGLKKAAKLGCKTIFITCVDKSKLQLPVEPSVIIDPEVGPEVIMGSTRLKCATAQKMICNMITSASMIRLGKVYENVMVDLQLTNKKLVERAKKIIMLFTNMDYEQAGLALDNADGHVKTALVMSITNSSKESAKIALNENNGFIKPAIEYIKQRV